MSRPMVDDMQHAFYQWRATHPHQAEDPLLIWAAAWHAGGKDALVRSAQLAELVPHLEELAALFWGATVDKRLDKLEEAEHGSPYWKTKR